MRRSAEGVALTTKDKEDNELLENVKLKNQVMLYNVDKETPGDITEAVEKQNSVQEGNTKILFKMDKKKRHLSHRVQEVSRAVFKILRERQKIFVGWQRIHLREYLSVPKC